MRLLCLLLGVTGLQDQRNADVRHRWNILRIFSLLSLKLETNKKINYIDRLPKHELVHKLLGRDFFSSRDEMKITAKLTDFRGKLINRIMRWRSILSVQFLNFCWVTEKRWTVIDDNMHCVSRYTTMLGSRQLPCWYNKNPARES